MAKFFAFTDRAIPVQFFEDDPIKFVCKTDKFFTRLHEAPL